MKLQAIAYPLMLVIVILEYVFILKWGADNQAECQRRLLMVQVDHAIDCATMDMLDATDSLGLDYANWPDVAVDPVVAFDSYVEMLLLANQFSDTPENRQKIIAEHIPFFMVCGYDGYYLLSIQDVNVKDNLYRIETNDYLNYEYTDYSLHCFFKVPYTLTVYENDTSTPFVPGFYRFNLGAEEYDRTTIDYVTTPAPGLVVQANGHGTCTTEQMLYARGIITAQLNDVINSALYTAMCGQNVYEIYIPAVKGEYTKSNPVTTVSCITIATDRSLSAMSNLPLYTVGSSSVIESNKVAVFYNPATAQYEYTDVNNPLLSNYTIDKVLSDREAAAKAGYFYSTQLGGIEHR